MVAVMFSANDQNKTETLSLLELWKGPQNFVNPLPAMINLAVQDVGQVDGAIDNDEFNRYNQGTSFIKEPRFSKSLFKSLSKNPGSKYEKKFKGPISSMTVSKFLENIAGEKKDYSDVEIQNFVEILRTAAGNWHENYEGKIHNDKLSEIFEKKNLDFDCWVVTDMPATGKIDIQPDGVVTQQNLFDFIDCMCGATAPESNQKDFSGIESILKSHINNNNFPEKVKALVNDFNLVQYMKDTG